METCEYLDSCPFYLGTIERKAVDIEKLKEEYCRKSPLRCARHMISVALGVEKIPEGLYPDEKMVAYELIAGSA
ncbi:hypothetical protein [Sediminispirochaeta smaragdinae]|jgi:hypothetical protein|uniref:Uncharacterized protein n=1 Tax=Sediminispirochaeta smaragdinae (strain DSM 11293 / JCM 15392 / SEBR 4228) TaxID=573413 RepID=E1R4V5_SEDSS|nr:hypothetical protein [Sediminispirochaeta smaragdinae]ADK82193.1 conserved hypothetical protein [Sediminispirochaeta smaragdinae DSM 11293]